MNAITRGRRGAILAAVSVLLAPMPAAAQGDLMKGLIKDLTGQQQAPAPPQEAAPAAPAPSPGLDEGKKLLEGQAAPSAEGGGLALPGGPNLDALQQQLGQKDGMISGLQSQLTTKDGLIGSLQGQLAEKDGLLSARWTGWSAASRVSLPRRTACWGPLGKACPKRMASCPACGRTWRARTA
jgi:hypothetical protein